jgi:hypothetical protein
MSRNPIWRESLSVFFFEGHGYQVYFYLLGILAPVEFLSLYVPSLDAQKWTGSASLFKVCATSLLLLLIYFSMRVANQEFAAWRFKPLRHWLREQGYSSTLVVEGQLGFLTLHVVLSLLLCAPLLAWAGAISRTPLDRLGVTFSLLSFYGLAYGVWGLAALALWERRIENRQVFVRCVFVTLVILSALFYLPLNPVGFLLAYLGRQELAPLVLFGSVWPAPWAHFGFHGVFAATGMALHRWAVEREARS